MIYTMYESGVMDTIPKCDCGQTTGAYNIGQSCDICGTEVRPVLYDKLEPILWIRAPKDVKCLINPHFWFLLNRAFTISNFSLVRYLCQTDYNASRNFKDLAVLQEMNIPRGYNHFLDNFYEIFEILANLKSFTKTPKLEAVEMCRKVMHAYKDALFCQHIPLPNKVLLVLEDTNMGKYMDYTFIDIIDAAQFIAGIDVKTRKAKSKHNTLQSISIENISVDSQDFIEITDEMQEKGLLLDDISVRRKENRTVKMMSALSDFYIGYYKKNLGKKAGLFRKHVFSSRANFSCRAVISSITEPHVYDELHIPWPLATGVLRYHILNKLKKLGFKLNEAVAFINQHTRVYHPLLDQIFKELINEAVFEDPQTGQAQTGLPVILIRNPSLGRGSALRLRVTKVRPDPDIWTLGISIISIRSLNALVFSSNVCKYVSQQGLLNSNVYLNPIELLESL